MSCPCGTTRSFEECCQPYLKGAPAPTAEALMRSRYSAYVKNEIDYILATHDPDTAKDVDRDATDKWSREADWQGLSIVSTEKGGEQDDTGSVEFIARYKAKGADMSHHEMATFRRIDGRWVFSDGQAVKPKPIVKGAETGRNDPCPCGSGKKFKKCHGGNS